MEGLAEQVEQLQLPRFRHRTPRASNRSDLNEGLLRSSHLWTESLGTQGTQALGCVLAL